MQRRCLRFDPCFRPLELGEYADRRLVDDAVACAIAVFGAPLLINKRTHKAKMLKDKRERLAIFDGSLCLLTMLKTFGRIMVGRQALMRQHPALAVFADAQDGALCAQAMLRGVEQYIMLKRSWRLFLEAQLQELCCQHGYIPHPELNFDLHRMHTTSIRRRRASVLHNGDVATKTLRLYADPLDPERSADAVAEAAAILRAGGTVAFATETVYGLGANALDPAAVARIFQAKQRPAWDPLIVHIADQAMLATVTAAVPEAARLWMQAFWPGPLTLLLPRGAAIPDAVTAGRLRVGVRMPRHPVAQALLRAAAIPIAAPSANVFGHVSPTSAAHVLADLDGAIDAVLDGGLAEHGLESTVVDACEDPCVMYRPGAITREQLASLWPQVVAYTERISEESKAPESMPSPGVGLRHYAPRAELILIEPGPRQQESLIAAATEATGVLLPRGFLRASRQRELRAGQIFAWGTWGDLASLGHSLFEGLRLLDATGVSRIVCPLPEPEGLGLALCDRLRKAARPRT